MKYYRVNKKNKRKLKREKIRNRKLIKQYPWILPRNVFTGKVPDDYDYSYVVWELPNGWYKAFGQMYLEELGTAVNEAGLGRDFMIYQIKEKYGSLRVYTSGASNKIFNIIDKYEHISENICIGCGRPDVPMINDGWYSPWCFECFKKNWRRREDYIKRSREKRGEDIKPPSSDEEIKAAYEKYGVSEPEMAMSYTIRRYGKDGDETEIIDISETVNKIRGRWEKLRRKNDIRGDPKTDR